VPEFSAQPPGFSPSSVRVECLVVNVAWSRFSPSTPNLNSINCFISFTYLARLLQWTTLDLIRMHAVSPALKRYHIFGYSINYTGVCLPGLPREAAPLLLAAQNTNRIDVCRTLRQIVKMLLVFAPSRYLISWKSHVICPTVDAILCASLFRRRNFIQASTLLTSIREVSDSYVG
jgi:hypothetical protein